MMDHLLFASRLHRTQIQTPDLVSELEASCWMIEDGDQAGHDWCEREGYPGYTSYASLNDLPARAPAFAALIEELDRAAKALSLVCARHCLPPFSVMIRVG